MELAQGLAVPIESVSPGDLVHGLTDDSAALTARPVTAVLPRGQRPCVELLFSDGRALTCTADHRILTADGAWTAAGDLVVGETEVSVGPTYPLQSRRDQRAADALWSVDLRDSLGFVLSTASAEDRARALAFARLAGVMLSDAAFSADSLQAKLLLSHQIDVQAARRDLATLKLELPDWSFADSIYSQPLPPAMRAAFSAIGGPGDERVGVVVQFPAAFTAAHCPTEVVREFLGGLFGGDGVSSAYSRASRTLVAPGFIAHKKGAAARGQIAEFQSVAAAAAGSLRSVDCQQPVRPHRAASLPAHRGRSGAGGDEAGRTAALAHSERG